MTIRVLVVDDSVVIRRLVSDLLSEDPDIEVVGTAVNGRAGLQKIAQLDPDLVTMDIEMPELDGIETVRSLRASGNRVPVIMFSTLTERGAAATLDALAAGASDYVPKPANAGSVGRSMELVREALIPRIKSLVPRDPSFSGPLGRVAPTVAPPLRRPAARPAGGHRLLVIGSSTGGPEALSTLFSLLPALPVPVAVVQHMPPLFTRQFAARLDRQLGFEVVEATDGQLLRPGTVSIAPGDFHLEVVSEARGLVTRLTQAPPENYCRPSVDVLFRSAVAAVGPAVLGVVLTGMGSDGRHGAHEIVERGGSVLAQDQASAVVWGMPGAVANAGLAEQVLPLREIGPELLRRLAPERTPLASTGARS
ncbi:MULTISPECIES: protein-glutamate methylesterase/protein-glutamine glutaminase [unclassified Nocardioides]|uniref:protein-glutamate methylesterase/protein-glutamine glutaminase n=1 Tax=unclassified Nocardioides TaxID=2615069 RepID=UPI0009F00C5C|nr:MULTISPECIES: chemotaxis response regulator protein-glutamate methylesterase [unclassified Nocardioides]GAW52220.1 response regulator receiver modulated CheB methylesterase [Nocardioides sp. PD653-B2]GAW56766.1 response regulator receiver modulated CheB methylesterase [Nocardioides sp. PD653]